MLRIECRKITANLRDEGLKNRGIFGEKRPLGLEGPTLTEAVHSGCKVGFIHATSFALLLFSLFRAWEGSF
jgi:hypothetical protein